MVPQLNNITKDGLICLVAQELFRVMAASAVAVRVYAHRKTK